MYIYIYICGIAISRLVGFYLRCRAAASGARAAFRRCFGCAAFLVVARCLLS